MKSRELRALSDEKLRDVIEDMKEQLYRLRLNQSTGELVDTSQFRKTRTEIARALTILSERQLGGTDKKGK